MSGQGDLFILPGGQLVLCCRPGHPTHGWTYTVQPDGSLKPTAKLVRVFSDAPVPDPSAAGAGEAR